VSQTIRNGHQGPRDPAARNHSFKVRLGPIAGEGCTLGDLNHPQAGCRSCCARARTRSMPAASRNRSGRASCGLRSTA